MRSMRTVAIAGALAAGALGALGAPVARADTSPQVVTATVESSVSISGAPSAAVDLGTLGAVDTATADGGTLAVQANVAYAVTVEGLKATMTAYADGAYDDTTALATPTAVLTTLAGGAGVPVAAVNVDTTPATIATGTGLTSDSYGLTLQQTTLLGDAPGSYRNELTYTAAATL